MKLFISHASEDKDDFARPLAKHLRDAKYEVWYDEFVLKLGDSLLQEISRGLRESDYGIVILSPAFFAKKWPKEELNGLFALQDETRKVILPVWKDVGVEEVKKFSPILADKVAAKASDGLLRVVEQIQQVIGFTETVASFDPLTAAKAKLVALDKQSGQHKAAKQLASSEKGVRLALEAAQQVCALVAETFTSFQKDVTEYRFHITFERPERLKVHTKHRLSLDVFYDAVYNNTVEHATIRAFVYKRRDFGEGAEKPFSKMEYAPWFVDGEAVVWRKAREAGVTNSQLAGLIVGAFVEKFAELDQRDRDS